MGWIKRVNDRMRESNERFDREQREEDSLGENGIRGKYLNFLKKPFSNSLKYLIDKVNPFNFICPHCIKTILADDINDVVCPYCDTVNNGCAGIFLKCPKCGRIMKTYKCPQCHIGIDLFEDYDEEELIRRSYE